MMRWIIASSLQLRLVMVAFAVLLMIFGFTQLRQMPVDTLPEFSRPYVEVQTEALGLSAAEVEALVTTPLEADLLNGVSWVEEIRSESIPGLSSIVLIFEKGTDIMRARQMVQERLIAVHALPNVSKPPAMLNPLSSASRCMEIGLTSKKLSLIEMSVLARWTIKPRLMGLPGVANVSIWGQRKRQLQVQLDPQRLQKEGATLMQVIRTVGNALWVSPLSFLEASTPGTGGWIETPNQRLGIRHILPISKPQELARVTLEGAPSKRLGDIVTVIEDHQPLIGDAIINDAPALMLVVEKFPWANTADVTREVEHALRALSPGLSGLEMDPTLFRPATFLELAVDHLSLALLIAAILAAIALFAFFLNWRVALISTVAVLLSVIIAMTVLYLRGVTINMMILAGLAMALTAILDDAVIDIERVAQYLREARKQGSQKSIATLIYEASPEMRTPIIYATLVMMLAVMPVIFLAGVSGAFLQPLAFSYILALIASLAVAMTVTPALSLVLLRRNSLRSRTPQGMQWLRRSYDVLFSRILKRPHPILIATAAMVAISLALLPLLRQETLLPTFKETDLLIRLEGSTGASHPAMSRIATLASRELRAIPGVRNVSAHLGRAVMSDKVTDVHRSEIWVSLDPSSDYDATVAAVKRVVAGYPGLASEVLTYLQAKVRDELSGTGESLIVRVYGEDMQIIREKAEEVHYMLDKIEGIEASKVQYPRERPTLEIEVDLDRAKRYGLKPGDIRRAATTMMSGILVGSLFEEQKVFDVVVWGTPETRHSLSSLQNLLIDTPSGGHVRLKEVADVRIAPAATVIHRDAVARRMDVTATVQGRDLVEVAEDVQQGLAQIEFPLEYRAELLGEYAERLAVEERVREYAIAAVIGIFLLLQAAFRNWRLAAAIFFTLPVTLLGGILVMFLTNGGLLSLGSMLGLVAVLGLAVRNTLVLIHGYRQREQMLHQAPGEELVRMATRDRSAAILLTAITTAAVLLPLVLLGNIAGLEILHPMAVVILGGLVTSSLFTLIGVPAAYLVFGAAREPELELEEIPVRVVTEEDVREFLSRSRDLEKQVQSTQ